MSLPISDKKLGLQYTKTESHFSVWAPTRSSVQLALYDHPKALNRTLYPMDKSEDGVYSLTLQGDYNGYYYAFIVDSEYEVTDPYSISSSLNSLRSAIVDLSATNPDGFANHKRPSGNNGCDAILYELHVKDFTGHPSSGVKHAGKYLGLSEHGTTMEGYTTGLDHLMDLGITHVHLMPVNDYSSVDESHDGDSNYNWGYDPEHYNLPEGSYSSDPTNRSRIQELKAAIQALHESGIKVILDVVYNHTFKGVHSNFNVLVPNYYYRVTEDGIFSNGSGCGNEFASEKPMARRFIIDSLCYWAKEYQVDGFRFDLMALIDLETISLALDALHQINPEIMVYGEPWTGGLSLLPDSKRVYKGAQCNNCFSLFNDDFRNAIKGDNDGNGKGFVQGNRDAEHATKVGILGSIPYDDHLIGFAMKPCETINYFNSHDNLILFDKIRQSVPNATYEDLIKINKLCFNILMTAQGIPFFHAGNEFLRDKKGHHNTYNAPLSINGIDWELKREHYAFYTYVRDLIELRKQHKALRMDSAESIKQNIHFVDLPPSASNAIAYTIHVEEDIQNYDCLLIAHNASSQMLMLSISEVLRLMCCSLGMTTTAKPSEIRIEQIFNESGLLHEPLLIPDHEKHIVGINPYSSSIYTFKKL